MADSVNGPEPTQVSAIGPLGALFLYSCVAVLCLCGPVMLAATVFTGAGLMVMGIVFTVIFVPVGLGLWGSTVVEREYNRRLDAVGVPATAEITDLTDFAGGEDTGVVVGLRVSGPGLRTFETSWRRSHHPALRVGRRLTAVVDPADNLFRVEL
ncbi:DUF3592 domain-containing protein [Streptomyces fulvoviolaceus]|uniref:DUF3592 domain-containing protein n=1 Tax=Streptomyces fulvoviolaceus TaxID=285535 RepID=UPI0021C21985|nr:DUF3592 domain-containing protein [Streptomyces fulvoviolaceus]MCT9082615.1 hypothetical protein [Streptomyces fulvoviolaceus]